MLPRLTLAALSYNPFRKNKTEGTAHAYGASGLESGQKIVSTYHAGPFVAGMTRDALNRPGLCQIPLGAGNSERAMAAVQLLRPDIVALTRSDGMLIVRGVNVFPTAVHEVVGLFRPQTSGVVQIRPRSDYKAKLGGWPNRNRSHGNH